MCENNKNIRKPYLIQIMHSFQRRPFDVMICRGSLKVDRSKQRIVARHHKSGAEFSVRKSWAERNKAFRGYDHRLAHLTSEAHMEKIARVPESKREQDKSRGTRKAYPLWQFVSLNSYRPRQLMS